MSRIKTERTAPIGLRLLDNGIGIEERQDITSKAKQKKERYEQQYKRNDLLPTPVFRLWVN